MAATKAPLCSGGMTHCSFCHGFSSFFFQRPTDRLVTDGVDDVEFDELVGQHLQGPAFAAIRRLGTRQGDELRFLLAVEFRRAVTLRPDVSALSMPSSAQRFFTR
jgi:hypothetical protein